MPMRNEDVSEHAKTVYAHFGLAFYHGQVLEHGIVNALVVLDLIPNQARSAGTPEKWANLVDKFYDDHFRLTLGPMMNALRRVTNVPPKLEGLLVKALETRNWLGHRYFRERAKYFMSPKGRDMMIAELEKARDMIHEAVVELEAIERPLAEKYGVTEDKVRREMDRIKATAP